MSTLKLGKLYETLAERFLKQEGIWVKARNVRFPQGEIDILGWDTRGPVLVEVRGTRSTLRAPLDHLSFAKKTRLLRLADILNRKLKRPVRVLFIEICGDPKASLESLRVRKAWLEV